MWQESFEQLDYDESAIWSLLLACGYLKLISYHMDEERGTEDYELAITNKEVWIMFHKMIEGWFARDMLSHCKQRVSHRNGYGSMGLHLRERQF